MYLSEDERSVFDRLRPSVEGLTTSELSERATHENNSLTLPVLSPKLVIVSP
jgi:hypothetical protein